MKERDPALHSMRKGDEMEQCIVGFIRKIGRKQNSFKNISALGLPIKLPNKLPRRVDNQKRKFASETERFDKTSKKPAIRPLFGSRACDDQNGHFVSSVIEQSAHVSRTEVVVGPKTFSGTSPLRRRPAVQESTSS